MTQKQKQAAKRDDEEVQDLPERTETDSNIDDILDAIDEVLEENAEEFVQGYIQRGGQ